MGSTGDLQSLVVKGHRTLCRAVSPGLSTQPFPEPGFQQPLSYHSLPHPQAQPILDLTFLGLYSLTSVLVAETLIPTLISATRTSVPD